MTFFVLNDERLALIRKPHYKPGLWRPPGGGLKPGEPLETGAKREAYEELGVEIELTQYLVRTKAVFTHGNVTIPWETHVFAATTDSVELDPVDTREISGARWGTLEELAARSGNACSEKRPCTLALSGCAPRRRRRRAGS